MEATEINLTPSNVRAETVIISTILTRPAAFTHLVGRLNPEHFYVALHGEIFRAAQLLNSQNKPVDLEHIYDWFQQRSLTDKFGGQKGFLNLSKAAIATPDLEPYVKAVFNTYKQRQYIEICQNAIALFSEDLETSESMFEQSLIDLKARTQTETFITMPHVLADAYVKLADNYEKRSLGQDTRSDNLPTGLTELDRLLDGGIPRERLVYILGASGMGKTTVGLQIAKHCSVNVGLPVLFFSLEMSSVSQAFKIIAADCEIPLGAIASGKFDGGKFDTVVSAIGNYQDHFVIDDRTTKISDICLKARQFHRQHGQIGMILIDYLTLIKTDDKSFGNRHQQIEMICQELNQLKKDLDTRVVVLTQIGRADKERSDKRPQITDAKESGAIEGTADIAIGCYRDEYYNKQSTDRNVVELIVLKNRYGRDGTTKFLWEGRYSRLRNTGTSEVS